MRHTFNITLPTDENGFVGRLCKNCKKYFKIKPGTGLPTENCKCPYCQKQGGATYFTTPDQERFIKETAEKVAYEKVVSPLLDKFSRSLKKLERSSGFIQIKVTERRDPPFFHIRRYREKDLETSMVCDGCGLHFSIFGAFASCPDCSQINAFTAFRKSAEVGKKKLDLVLNLDGIGKDIIENEFKSILSDTVAAFDGLGKELKTRFPEVFPVKPKNLFQNLAELDKCVEQSLGVRLSDHSPDFDFISKMFQVRHIYIHNMGVIDEDFVKKQPDGGWQIGRKYPLEKPEIDRFVASMDGLVDIIEDTLFLKAGEIEV